MTHKTKPRYVNLSHKNREKKPIARELACAAVLLSSCGRNDKFIDKKTGVDLTPGKPRPKIMEREDGTQVIIGLEGNNRVFGNSGMELTALDAAGIIAAILILRFSKMKMPDKKKPDRG